MEDIYKLVTDFRDERGWSKNHSLKDLAISISLEANELLENFQWRSNEEAVAHPDQNITEEMADVLIYLIQMADVMDIDLESAVRHKLKKNALKYPVPSKG